MLQAYYIVFMSAIHYHQVRLFKHCYCSAVIMLFDVQKLNRRYNKNVFKLQGLLLYVLHPNEVT